VTLPRQRVCITPEFRSVPSCNRGGQGVDDSLIDRAELLRQIAALEA